MTQPVSPPHEPATGSERRQMLWRHLAYLPGLWAGLIRLVGSYRRWRCNCRPNTAPHGVWLPGHADLSGAGGGVKLRIRSGRRIYYLSPLLAGLGALALFTALAAGQYARSEHYWAR